MQLNNIKTIKVLIIGLGQLGLPVAKYVKGKGFDTYGYDISSQAMEYAEKTAQIKQAVDFGGTTDDGDFDVFLICISTHKPDEMLLAQTDGILSIADKISKKANKKDGALVSIESTISKGTSKKVFEILNHRLHVVNAPHRWYALEENIHGVNQQRVIGGVRDCCLKAGMQFYNDGTDNLSTTPYYKSLGIPMHPVSTAEIAETTKVVEGADRYLQIAFAEDLYLYCQANNINFPELRDALNTKWNVEILQPKEGIGGHCLPKDTRMFLESSRVIKSKILRAAMEVDEDYRKFRATLERDRFAFYQCKSFQKCSLIIPYFRDNFLQCVCLNNTTLATIIYCSNIKFISKFAWFSNIDLKTTFLCTTSLHDQILWNSIANNYEMIQGAQIANSFILSTQISEIVTVNHTQPRYQYHKIYR